MIIKDHKLNLKFDDAHGGTVSIEWRGTTLEVFPSFDRDRGAYLFLRIENSKNRVTTEYGTRIYCKEQD